MKAKIRHAGALFLFCTTVIVLTVSPALATSVIVPSDEELVVGSRAIVRGQVTNVTSGFDTTHKGIFTYITFQVAQVYKGSFATNTIVIKEPGGTDRDSGSLIFGIPTFSVGEENLLYLDTWPDGSLRVYQWFLGKFNITTDQNTGRPMLTRTVASPRVDILGRSNAGTVTDHAELESYANALRTRISAFQLAGRQHEARHYANVKLLARPLELQTNSGVSPVQNFTVINPSQPPRWFEPDSGQPVVFKINTAGAFNADVVNSVSAAMNAWSSVSGSAIRVVSGGSTSGCGLLTRDGENTVSFNNCDNYLAFAPPAGSTCSGVLAAAGIINYSLVQTRVVNGLTFYKALEGNLAFNPYASCYFTSSCNVAEVATHELGHALGFGHSLDSTATMYAYAHFDGRCAGLKPDDESAVRFVYPGSGNPTPTPTPIPTPTPTPIPTPTPTPAPAPITISTNTLATAEIGLTYTQTLTATGGTPPYSWMLIAGSLPAGLNLSTSGILTGAPFDQGTFSITVRVSTAAGQSAQKAFSLFVNAPTPAPPPSNGRHLVRGDFDGDGKTDLSVWRGTSGYWYIMKSSGNLLQTILWGAQIAPYYDVPVPGDYDGDGKTDQAVWRPSLGIWYIMRSSNGTYAIQQWGQNGDTPVPGDYDGDGITDLAVWRGSTGAWTIRLSSTGQTRTVMYGSGAAPYYDVPVPADYDGDGKTDIATWRGSSGLWSIRQSSTGQTRTATWGMQISPYSDTPEPGDYDGDGKTDIAVWRPADGKWYILLSSTNASRVQAHGQSGDTPLPAKQP